MRAAAALALCLLAAACGPGPDKIRTAVAAPPLEGPVHEVQGSLSSQTLDTVTLDHGGAPDAGLAAGRTTFVAFADVMASAPVTPGAPVTAKFRKQGQGWALTELAARP
jgi:hypothetical protein